MTVKGSLNGEALTTKRCSTMRAAQSCTGPPAIVLRAPNVTKNFVHSLSVIAYRRATADALRCGQALHVSTLCATPRTSIYERDTLLQTDDEFTMHNDLSGIGAGATMRH